MQVALRLADPHVQDVHNGYRDEPGPHLAGHRASQERLAAAGWSVEQQTTAQTLAEQVAQLLVAHRGQERHLQALLDLHHAADVGQADRRGLHVEGAVLVAQHWVRFVARLARTGAERTRRTAPRAHPSPRPKLAASSRRPGRAPSSPACGRRRAGAAARTPGGAPPRPRGRRPAAVHTGAAAAGRRRGGPRRRPAGFAGARNPSRAIMLIRRRPWHPERSGTRGFVMTDDLFRPTIEDRTTVTTHRGVRSRSSTPPSSAARSPGRCWVCSTDGGCGWHVGPLLAIAGTGAAAIVARFLVTPALTGRTSARLIGAAAGVLVWGVILLVQKRPFRVYEVGGGEPASLVGGRLRRRDRLRHPRGRCAGLARLLTPTPTTTRTTRTSR